MLTRAKTTDSKTIGNNTGQKRYEIFEDTILKNNTLVSIQYFRASSFIKADNFIKEDNL